MKQALQSSYRSKSGIEQSNSDLSSIDALQPSPTGHCILYNE